MFQTTQNDAYLGTVSQRIENEYLTWCEQFLDIIADQLEAGVPCTLNDIGCCAGQFYKSLKRRNLPVSYRGFDIEPAYLEIACRYFPELAGSVRALDVEQSPPPQADITVVSATLEHLNDPFLAVAGLLASTNRIFLARSFIGGTALDQWLQKPGASAPYRIRQFRQDEFAAAVESQGFDVKFLEDRYTKSEPFEIAPGIVRVQRLVLGMRRA